MNPLTKRAFAFALAAAAIAAASPSFAQSRQHVARAQAQYAQPSGVTGPISGDGYPVPAKVLNAPYQCWSDDGYGRWSSCDAN